MADFKKLEENITEVIKEQQIKLGYRRERICLYYPLKSLNRLLGTKCNLEQIYPVLESFCATEKEWFGDIQVTNEGKRFCLTIPPKGVEYVHEKLDEDDFLVRFIQVISQHGCTLNDIFQVFGKYSDKIHAEKMTGEEFDYLIYFEDGIPNHYRYCITDEGCHMIYHRYTQEDYVDFGFAEGKRIPVELSESVKIKVCGLTKPEEAEYLNRNHVDFAGMVLFFPKSRRNISPERAVEIRACLDPEIKTVAVVVSPSVGQVKQIEGLGFDYIQIHGKIPEGMFDEVHIPVLKAFNVSDMKDYEVYSACKGIAGYVFDAQEPGSGKVFDWSLVKQVPQDGKLLLLAGGLNPENVQEAVRYLHPDGVDVSSGVEYPGGGKDGEKVDAFVRSARKKIESPYEML